MNLYKYFFIYDRNGSIIYGECVEWRCGEFDSDKLSDVIIGLKKKFSARIITSNSKIENIDFDKKTITIEEINFNFYEKYEEFITQRYDEILFNPLIDRCSNIVMFSGHEMRGDQFDEWVEDNKSLLEQIKSKFDLDFLARPELINSYTYYKPNRIVVSSKFIDKSMLRDSPPPRKIKTTIYDEFNEYSDSNCIVSGHFSGDKSHTVELKVSDKEIVVEFDESPDELEVKISKDSELIYSSRFGFVKSINVRATVVGDSVTLDNGSTVSRRSTTDINVGKP